MQEGTLTLLLEMAERGAAAAPRPAEEIAREMVPEPRQNALGLWEFWIKSGSSDDDAVVVEDYNAKVGAELDADVVRDIIARAITQARADGAAAALAGQQPVSHVKVTSVVGRWTGGDPDETDRIVDDAGDTWPLDRRFVPGPLEHGAFSDGASGPFRVTVERFDGQQTSDLAGRIREALQRIMPAPHATHDGTAWEGVAVKPDGTGLRLGLTWSRDESAQRRDAAIDYMVNELETIVRECAPTEGR
jgi:hypothetical protein